MLDEEGMVWERGAGRARTTTAPMDPNLGLLIGVSSALEQASTVSAFRYEA